MICVVTTVKLTLILHLYLCQLTNDVTFYVISHISRSTIY